MLEKHRNARNYVWSILYVIFQHFFIKKNCQRQQCWQSTWFVIFNFCPRLRFFFIKKNRLFWWILNFSEKNYFFMYFCHSFARLLILKPIVFSSRQKMMRVDQHHPTVILLYGAPFEPFWGFMALNRAKKSQNIALNTVLNTVLNTMASIPCDKFLHFDSIP